MTANAVIRTVALALLALAVWAEGMEELSAGYITESQLDAVRATGACVGDIAEDLAPYTSMNISYGRKCPNVDTALKEVGKILKGVHFGYAGVYIELTNVTDDGLRHLKHIRNLGTLYVGGTKVTDAGLAHLKECKNLKLLQLKDTQVTKAGCEELKKALPNVTIRLWIKPREWCPK